MSQLSDYKETSLIGLERSILFGRLYRWASGQEENFNTECLACFLNLLVNREPSLATAALSWLSGARLLLDRMEARSVTINTQVREEGDQPDIWIRGPSHLLLVEVKIEAPPNREQLRRYQQLLHKKQQEEGIAGTLTFITKYAVPTPSEDSPDVSRRWYQVADWFGSKEVHDPVVSYMRDEWISFLRERGMTMDKVTSELLGGAKSILDLLRMAQEAFCAIPLRPSKITGSGGPSCGFAVPGHGMQFWAAVDLESPQCLHLHAEPVDAEKARACGSGRVHERGYEAGRGLWRCDVPLDDHFYSLDRDRQMAYLEVEIRKRVDLAHSLS